MEGLLIRIDKLNYGSLLSLCLKLDISKYSKEEKEYNSHLY